MEMGECHSGLTFCAIGSLKLMNINISDVINEDKLLEYIVHR
jgi:prenyltransferase beta subunit